MGRKEKKEHVERGEEEPDLSEQDLVLFVTPSSGATLEAVDPLSPRQIFKMHESILIITAHWQKTW